MSRRLPARVDAVVDVTRPAVLGSVDARTVVVVTAVGLVVVDVLPRWTWFRWVMGRQLWSVTKDGVRDVAQAKREAARLILACREKYRRRG